MKTLKHTLLASALAACAVLASPASAQTVRIANQGDMLALDPHSLNETLQLSSLLNVFDALTMFDQDLKLQPGLATAWRQTSPTVWRFELRQGVKFHDGAPFTADDVVFSFARAAAPTSNMQTYVNDIEAVRKLDDYTVEIETKVPFPILPEVLNGIYIMNKKWSEDNQATLPIDRRTGTTNTAAFRANGTGPYRVTERQPDVRTVFVRNDDYWGEIAGNVREVIFTPVANDATRVAALLSGGVDVMEPVPVQDIGRINANPGTQVITAPELRTIFLGMDQHRDELLYGNIKDKNPFKDKRVRQAFYQAIDIEGIKKTVMRGLSTPSALMVAPGINGFQDDIKRLPFDVAAAQKLMADAGYGEGFEVSMNCPNDRYVNDSRICQTVAANLSRIGVKVNVVAETKTTYFAKILRRDTSFYMLGWTPSTYDAHNPLNALMACPDDAGAGGVNYGVYCNAKVDELTKKIQVETDPQARTAMIREAFIQHAEDIGHIPLHQQALAWGVSNKVKVTQRADNYMQFKWMHVNP